jgi:hypothetical protein
MCRTKSRVTPRFSVKAAGRQRQLGWFKLVLVILVVAGLTWLALFCDSWHKYREHVERLSELREEVRRRPRKMDTGLILA